MIGAHVVLDVWKCTDETRQTLTIKLDEHGPDIVVPTNVIGAASEVWGHGDSGKIAIDRRWAEWRGLVMTRPTGATP